MATTIDMRKIIYALLLFISIALCWFYLKNRSNSPLLTKNAAPTTQNKKLSIEARQIVKTQILPQQNIDTNCEPIYQFLINQSVDAIIDRLTQLTTMTSATEASKCVSFISSTNANFTHCLELVNHPQNSASKSNCTTFITFWRALVIDTKFADAKNYETMEYSILVNKLIALTLKLDKITAEQKQEFLKIAESLLTRNPENVEVLKAHMMGLFLTRDAASLLKPDSEFFNELKQALQLSPEDKQLNDMYLASFLFTDNALPRLQQFVQEHPNNASGYYATAFLLFKQGHLSESIRNLEYALQIEPNNESFKKTYVLAKDPNTNKESKIFFFSLGFNPNDL